MTIDQNHVFLEPFSCSLYECGVNSGLFFQHSSLNSRVPKLKIFAKLKDILINSRASHLNSIVLHLKLKDFLSKLKYFSAKLKEFAAKLKTSANLFAPDGGQTLKKQAWFNNEQLRSTIFLI